MEAIEILFKTYGFQSATLLAIISFFATRYFGLRDKKVELRHTLFQQLKVDSINSFIESYSNSELCWVQLPYYDILEHKISGKELDLLVIPTHNILNASYNKLFVFLNEKEMKEFTEIFVSVNNVKKLLSRLMHDYGNVDTFTKVDNYVSATRDMTRDNAVRLKLIGEKFRDKYT